MTYSCECQTQRWSSLACWCPTWLAVAVTAALSKQLPYGTWLSCSRNSHSNATHTVASVSLNKHPRSSTLL